MHIPVLQKEVIEYLDPKPNENFIDCTFGEGGHALAILERNGPNGKVLGIDQDQEIIKNFEFRISNFEFRKRLILVCDSYTNLEAIVRREKFSNVQGIFFDLGMSSWHLEESGRGFSFQRKEPLDMRYNSENPKSKIQNPKLTAEKILNYYSRQEIEKILREYGEERFAKEISQEIINFRQAGPIKNTFQLVEIIKKAVPRWYQRQRINPVTRTFQALRIAVNDELNNLNKALPQSLEVLKTGGRLAVISFHSLEDRIVKNFFSTSAEIEILTKKPILASLTEVRANPLARSAKLRAAIKL